jgi:hypothetical protein
MQPRRLLLLLPPPPLLLLLLMLLISPAIAACPPASLASAAAPTVTALASVGSTTVGNLVGSNTGLTDSTPWTGEITGVPTGSDSTVVLSATSLPVLLNSDTITVQRALSSTGGGSPVVTGDVATIISSGAQLQVPITALSEFTAGATYTFSLTVASGTVYASVTRYFAVRVKYGAWGRGQKRGREGGQQRVM